MSEIPSGDKEIYFELVNHDLITGTTLRYMMYVLTGDSSAYMISDSDVRKFSKTCGGIVREIKHPSVTKLIEYGFKTTAVKVCYKETPNISLSEARKYVERLSLYMISDLCKPKGEAIVD